MRHFIYLRYDGSAYHGWQAQPGAATVQGELARALSLLLGTPTDVVGAGRTDTGVHARMMVAHFDFAGDVDAGRLAFRLNRILPRDISVDGIVPVRDGAHARFSATSRTYHYYVHLGKDPFLGDRSLEVRHALDFGRMNEAAACLVGSGDFSSFCKSHSSAMTMTCRVMEAAWHRDGERAWHFRITADRFLRNMVRAVVGTLLEVGRGRMDAGGLRHVMECRDRCRAGESVPARALFLESVTYGRDIFPAPGGAGPQASE